MENKKSLSNPDIAPKQENIKYLFEHCYEIQKIQKGDLIPAGGENFLSSEMNIKFEADFQNFKEFFLETHALAVTYDLPKLKEQLQSLGVTMNEKTFAILLAFTKKLQEKHPYNQDNENSRKDLYHKNLTKLKLSDVFNAHSMECAEIAALAKGYLQAEQVPSSYFSGDVLWDKEGEHSEPHSFIVIREDGNIYIYDPANPINTTAGEFPSIYTIKANFDEEMSKGQKRFVTAINMLSKRDAFFGMNNQTNIIPEKHIV